MYGRRRRVAKVAQYKQSISLTIIHVHSAYSELPRRSFSDVPLECCETSTVFVFSTQTFVFSTLTSVARRIATAVRLFVVSSKPLHFVITQFAMQISGRGSTTRMHFALCFYIREPSPVWPTRAPSTLTRSLRWLLDSCTNKTPRMRASVEHVQLACTACGKA